LNEQNSVRSLFHPVAGILVLVAAVSAIHAHPAVTQDLRVQGIAESSTQPLVDGATGFGVHASLDLSDWISATAGFTQTASTSERGGTACGVFRPYPTDCEADWLEEHVRMRSYRAGVRTSVDPVSWLSVGVVAGGSLNEIRSRSRGVATGLPGTLYSPTTANLGAHAGLDLTWRPVGPVGMVLGATKGWIAFEGCRENPLDYAPFCGTDSVLELHLGLSVRLRP
jgi:hypothetical protein